MRPTVSRDIGSHVSSLSYDYLINIDHKALDINKKKFIWEGQDRVSLQPKHSMYDVQDSEYKL